ILLANHNLVIHEKDRYHAGNEKDSSFQSSESVKVCTEQVEASHGASCSGVTEMRKIMLKSKVGQEKVMVALQDTS
ncbi:hypothetical protein TNCT_173211, partial [Trichonephila clavata]